MMQHEPTHAKNTLGSLKHYDVVVIGAGTAGVAAAIRAGRDGSSCALVEKNGIPGGTITAAGIAAPGLFAVNGKQIISGIGWELVCDTLAEMGSPAPDLSKWNDVFWKNQIDINPIVFAAVCDEKLLSANVDIRYHTMLAALKDEGDFWRVTLCGKEGLFNVNATTVIDCTGDANATSIAGYETIIPESCQPGTYSVKLENAENSGNIDELKKHFQEALAQDAIRPSDVGWAPGYSSLFLERKGVNANHVCNINAYSSEARTQAEIAGRAAVLRAYRFYKSHQEFENLNLLPAAFECGIRESRVIKGEYTITDEDYQTGRRFPDAVCQAWYPMDRHENDHINARKIPESVIPTIPQRALIPAGSRRFAAAGRIISSTQGANAGLRVQAVCMATGEVCGAMAHIAAKTGVDMRQVPLQQLPFYQQLFS